MFNNLTRHCLYLQYSIQFNSKHLFKDGDPRSLQLIFPGAIQNM